MAYFQQMVQITKLMDGKACADIYFIKPALLAKTSITCFLLLLYYSCATATRYLAQFLYTNYLLQFRHIFGMRSLREFFFLYCSFSVFWILSDVTFTGKFIRKFLESSTSIFCYLVGTNHRPVSDLHRPAHQQHKLYWCGS